MPGSYQTRNESNRLLGGYHPSSLQQSEKGKARRERRAELSNTSIASCAPCQKFRIESDSYESYIRARARGAQNKFRSESSATKCHLIASPNVNRFTIPFTE